MLTPVLVPTGDERGLILVRTAVLGQMHTYRQTCSDHLEAGGVLLGSLRGPHIDVVACTVPLPSDRRGRYVFERLDSGHVIAVKEVMKASKGTIGYVGEWHTHPEPFPAPSGQDLTNWVDLLHRTKQVLAMVIVGTEGLFVTSPLAVHKTRFPPRIVKNWWVTQGDEGSQ